jgi:tetratricopeptide (TPR) repeat protein
MMIVMLTSADYEIKFRLYDGNESNIDEFIKYYTSLKEEYLKKGTDGSVHAKVISYFFDGMIKLVQGDRLFWNEDYLGASQLYAEATRFFNRFKNSRSTDYKLDLLGNRMLHRSKGMEALTVIFNSKDYSKKELKLLDALENFNNETEAATNMKEEIPAIIAFSRALLTESFLWRDRSELQKFENSFEAKKGLMYSRSVVRQAAFIDIRMRVFMEEIENKIDDLTKERILLKAEEFGNLAIEESENGNYQKSKQYYDQATLFYGRASSLVSDSSSRRFLLSMRTVLEASMLECDANQAYRVDNNMVKANEFFLEANLRVEKAIALMGSFGNEDLRLSFVSQKNFYKAMAHMTQGINYFDEEKYQEAMEEYKQANELFTQSMEDAKASLNEPLTELGERCQADLDGYINMCETFIS